MTVSDAYGNQMDPHGGRRSHWYAGYPLAVLLLAVSCHSALAPTGASQTESKPAIVVLGDSLAVSPSREEGFPAELQARLTQRNPQWTIVNASNRGDTTADGLRRLDTAITAGIRVLVVALGANDGVDGVNVSTVERNLAEIIARAKARNISVLLCGMDAPPVHGLDYSIAFHQIYDRLAANHGVPLVPFLLVGIILNPEMTLTDRIHPNAAGARRFADRIWPHLEPLIEKEEQITAIR